MKNKSKLITNFLEAKDPEGKEWEVVIIQAGESENKNSEGQPRYYSPETLKKAVDKGIFENVKCFAYEFTGKVFNHLPTSVQNLMPQGFVKNLVGGYDNIRYGTFRDENGQQQEGVLAKLHIFENAKWLRDLLKETWQKMKSNLLELSIDAQGVTKKAEVNSKIVDWVEEIKNATSVDVVTRGACGGKFARLIASKQGGNIMNWKELLGIIKSHNPALVEGVDEENVLEEQAISLLGNLVSIRETSEKFQERLGFYTTMIDQVIELVEGKKNEKADSLLEEMKKKMEAYGFNYPVSKEKGTHSYPYVKESHGFPISNGANGFLCKIEEQEVPGETEEEKKKREEEEAKKKAAAAAASQEGTKNSDKKVEEALNKVNKIEEDLKREKSKALLTSILAESGLTDLIKKRIVKMFEGKIFEKSSVEKAIQEEKEFVSKLSESGEVRGLGQSGITVGMDHADKLQIAMDRMFDDEYEDTDKSKGIPAFRGLKEAYVALHSEDPMISGNIDRSKHFSRLTEATTSSDFTYALGTSMERKLVKAFQKKPFIFAPIVTEVPITNFKSQERVKWGGYSTLPTVTEDAAYADLYTPKDEEATYSAATKGGYVSVSRKTIKNDDLGLIKRIPQMMGVAGKRTLERNISDLLCANGTYTPTNTTLFSTTFGNYSTNALNYDNLKLSKKRMRKQKERGSAQLSGTATSATSTTLADTSESANIVDDAYNGEYLRIVYGTGAGQTRLITDTSTAASVITISPAWTATPSTDSIYEVSVASNDDEQIGITPKYLIHGEELDGVVDALLLSPKRYDNAENEINVHKKFNYVPIYSPYIAGSTYQYYWFLAADKSEIDIIEVGYIDNQKTPQMVIQDQPALGQVFTNDRIRWRVRFEYGYAAIENKALDGNFATTI